MKYVAAYMLLALGGKESPSAEEIKGLLTKAGVEVDDEKLATFAKTVEGKNVAELLEQGQSKMKAIAGAAGPGPSAGGAGGAAAAEEKEEEEEEEEEGEA